MSVCRYCTRTAKFVYQKAGVRLCSKCMNLATNRRWEDLASRWLRERPQDWIPDVAAYLELGEEKVFADEPYQIPYP